MKYISPDLSSRQEVSRGCPCNERQNVRRDGPGKRRPKFSGDAPNPCPEATPVALGNLGRWDGETRRIAVNSWLLDDFDAAQSPSLTAKTPGKRNAVKAAESGADADLSENVRLLLHRLDRLDTRVKAGRRTTSLSRQRSHAGTAACRAAFMCGEGNASDRS
jgi:hypothetical protein